MLVGGRMSEAAAQGYTLFDIPTPRQRLIHVHADPLEIGRNYHPTLGIIATSPEFCAALEGVQPPATIPWSAETRQARADYLAWSEQAPPNPGRVQVSEIMFALRRRVPDAIFATGAGNFTIWVGRFLRFRRIEQQLGPTSGSMGFGVPAAIGAARVFPGQDRHQFLWRRRFFDERAGVCDRRPVWAADPRHPDRQRHSTERSACTRNASSRAG